MSIHPASQLAVCFFDPVGNLRRSKNIKILCHWGDCNYLSTLSSITTHRQLVKMVHYRTPDAILGPRHSSDYWKLRKPVETRERLEQHLANQDIPFSRKTDTSRLLALLERHQLGLLLYDSCSTAELIQFACKRKLDTSLLPKKPKSALRLATTALLEQADKNLTFTKILDLPPELRLRIYEHHYNSFDLLCLSGPSPAPNTLFCSLLRH